MSAHDPPNVLFLMADQHRADVAGFAGDDVVRTPTLDRIADDGVVFENAYTPAPVCVPARQSLAAGQYPSTCDCRAYGEDLDPGYLTFARQFSRHGYDTVACGKLHHYGPDQMQGWRRRYGEVGPVLPTYIDTAEDVPDRTGLQTVEQNKMVYWVKQAGPADPVVDPMGRDEYATAGALRHLRRRYFEDWTYENGREYPLFLMVSLLQPHFPYNTEQGRYDYYRNRVTPYEDQPTERIERGGASPVRPGTDVSTDDLRRATAAYYGMVETVDEQFERVLQTLEDAGEDLDEWIIVYTSDHGDMLGEKGAWGKNCFYEASVRVPLLVRWPERFSSRTVSANVSLCDLFATLCDLAEIPVPSGLDSRSLDGLLTGAVDREGWRTRHDDEVRSELGSGELMIRRGELKYERHGDEEVLIDLQADPSEEENLATRGGSTDVLESFRDRADELGW